MNEQNISNNINSNSVSYNGDFKSKIKRKQ